MFVQIHAVLMQFVNRTAMFQCVPAHQDIQEMHSVFVEDLIHLNYVKMHVVQIQTVKLLMRFLLAGVNQVFKVLLLAAAATNVKLMGNVAPTVPVSTLDVKVLV